MGGVLTGFAVVAALIALGALAARLGVVPGDGDKLLARILFYIAMPALLFTTMSRADPADVFSPLLVGVLVSVLATAALFLLLAPRRLSWSERVVGAMGSCYVNAGNLGIPIAAYVLGDAALIAPVLFVQLLVLAPVGLSLLDVLGGGGRGGARAWLLPVTNPIVLATLAGVIVALAELPIPEIVLEPIALMGGAAVPLALFAYGVSLAEAMRTRAVRATREVLLATVLKSFAHPLIGYLVGAHLLDLDPAQTAALTLFSALPTAQNIYVYSLQYRTGMNFSRSLIVTTTVLSIPVLGLVAFLL